MSNGRCPDTGRVYGLCYCGRHRCGRCGRRLPALDPRAIVFYRSRCTRCIERCWVEHITEHWAGLSVLVRPWEQSDSGDRGPQDWFPFTIGDVEMIVGPRSAPGTLDRTFFVECVTCPGEQRYAYPYVVCEVSRDPILEVEAHLRYAHGKTNP